MDQRFDVVENKTLLIVNSNQLDIPGVGNANQGRLTSIVEHKLPFSIEILAPMMIVGYPTYSEYLGDAHDLFKPSTLAGGYKYRRVYRFSDGAEFNSFHNILYDNDQNRLAGVFATSDFPEDNFSDAWRIHEELVETFIPHVPGMIRSTMATEWRDGAKRLHAVIESEYYFNHNESLPGLHWRHVRFSNQHEGEKYIQSEKITVLNHFDFGAPANQFSAS
jgi:hypothetical protein